MTHPPVSSEKSTARPGGAAGFGLVGHRPPPSAAAVTPLSLWQRDNFRSRRGRCCASEFHARVGEMAQGFAGSAKALQPKEQAGTLRCPPNPNNQTNLLYRQNSGG